jgi:RNA polymerase sigma-70 factor, ECF subfamily
MTTHEIELKALMLASLDGDAASHCALLDCDYAMRHYQ